MNTELFLKDVKWSMMRGMFGISFIGLCSKFIGMCPTVAIHGAAPYVCNYALSGLFITNFYCQKALKGRHTITKGEALRNYDKHG